MLKEDIIEEFNAQQFDIIEKEVEKTVYMQERKVHGYSYLVLTLIFLMYTGNQWQRYSNTTHSITPYSDKLRELLQFP